MKEVPSQFVQQAIDARARAFKVAQEQAAARRAAFARFHTPVNGRGASTAQVGAGQSVAVYKSERTG